MCFDHLVEDVLVNYSRFTFVALGWNRDSKRLQGTVVCLQGSFPILFVRINIKPQLYSLQHLSYSFFHVKYSSSSPGHFLRFLTGPFTKQLLKSALYWCPMVGVIQPRFSHQFMPSFIVVTHMLSSQPAIA